MIDVRASTEPAHSLLAAFSFADPGRPEACPLPRLAGPADPECWHATPAGAFRIESVSVGDSEDIESAAHRAYTLLLQRVRGSAQPYLLRIWNFLDGINEGEGDAERYRAFCVGRAAAVDASFHAPPPAATAIGLPTGRPSLLQVVALCGANTGIALENPRQTPAWRYPREYGPVSPGFSRGAVLGSGEGSVLLASGTASIIGHISRHPGDVETQLEESLRNLEALLEEGERRSGSRFRMGGCAALRVYLRHAGDAPRLLPILRRTFGINAPVRLLHGDICRRELDVELEGVFPAQQG
ncbi:pteridine-dependent deoxygenase [Pseudomarimonas salicorniae]|uniref:Pteridine-dependent deoxygenase n=1 Tax=Pseudomarimonas salicorniae TaxID=2933270 RepID=A0ABT0GEC1_9GAMM|nr:pteridine-dependent deoxygenase [Lysobacter sp. CAU 1642]MCK7592897.1 pteridine-dependent deoxygenase [Lysobacter sp. CAU 1642]